MYSPVRFTPVHAFSIANVGALSSRGSLYGFRARAAKTAYRTRTRAEYQEKVALPAEAAVHQRKRARVSKGAKQERYRAIGPCNREQPPHHRQDQCQKHAASDPAELDCSLRMVL